MLSTAAEFRSLSNLVRNRVGLEQVADIVDGRKNQSFQDFRGWAEKRDMPLRSS